MGLTTEKIAHNTAFYTGGLIAQKIVSFFYFIIIARFLGAEDIGKYVLALSITTILLIIIDSGISPAITRETARNKETASAYLPSIIIYKIIASVVIYFFALAFVNFLGYPEITKQLVYLAGVVMVLDTFSLTFYAVLRGLHILKYESFAISVYQLIVLAIGLGGLFMGASVHILMVALIVASTFNLIFAYSFLNKNVKISFRENEYMKRFKEFMKYALPFAATAIFIKIHFASDTIILSLLSTERELGLYSVAHKFVFALEFIPLAFVATSFPALSTFFRENKDMMMHVFNKSSFYLMLIALPIVFGGYVIAEPLTHALYGKEFASSATSLSILLLGILFLFLNYPFGSFLGAIQRQKTNMYLMGVAVLTSLLLNIYLIPIYGGAGAAIAFFISSFILFVSYFIAIKIILKISLKKYIMQLANITIISFIMGVVVDLVLESVHFLLATGIGAIVYIVLIFGTKVLSVQDIRELTGSLKNIKGSI